VDIRARLRSKRFEWGWGFSPRDVEAYGFDKGRPYREAARYLGYRTYKEKVRPKVNYPAARWLVENKWIFYQLADIAALPVPPTLGIVHPIFGVSWGGDRPLQTVPDVLAELRRVRPDQFVAKPCGGQQGRGVIIANRVDYSTGNAVTLSGERIGLQRLAERMLSSSPMRGVPGYLLQHFVRQHPFFASLSPFTTNTVRLVTFIAASGRVDVPLGMVRIGRSGAMADNPDQGGIGVSVDLETGILGRGTTKAAIGVALTHHPDTGEKFEGRIIPDWHAIVDLVRRAATMAPGLRAIGWDVVLTEAGPLIIEANADWNARLQAVSGGWLSKPGVRGELSHFGITLPDGRLMPGAIRDAKRLLRGKVRAVVRSR
jgi:hypothetical protein